MTKRRIFGIVCLVASVFGFPFIGPLTILLAICGVVMIVKG